MQSFIFFLANVEQVLLFLFQSHFGTVLVIIISTNFKTHYFVEKIKELQLSTPLSNNEVTRSSKIKTYDGTDSADDGMTTIQRRKCNLLSLRRL